MPVTACTAIPRGRLPLARVLAASLVEHHPEASLTVLLLDDRDGTVDDAREPFHVLRPPELEAAGAGRWAMVGGPDGMAAALRPFLLRHLLGRGHPHVLWLDPATRLFASVADVAEAAEVTGMALVPRQLTLAGAVGEAGVYESGLLGAGGSACDLLERWMAQADPGHARVLDRGPALHPGAAVVADAGVGVAHWNLRERPLAGTPDRLTAGGAPLRSFVFHDFDPTQPYWLTRGQAEVRVSDDRVLAGLCERRAGELMQAGFDLESDGAWAYDTLPNGIRLDRLLCGLFADAHAHGEAIGDPFEPAGAERFRAWLNGPVDGNGSKVSRYMAAVYDRRPDLHAAFPDPGGRDAEALVDWMRGDGARDDPNLAVLLNGSAREGNGRPRRSHGSGGEREAEPAREHGVSVVGYLRNGLGLGEAARLYTHALEAAGLPVRARALDPPHEEGREAFGRVARPKRVVFSRASRRASYPNRLLCMNPPELLEARQRGVPLPKAERTVGVWAWEAEPLPAGWVEACSLVDEIWVYSQHVAALMAPAVPVPVVVAPLPVRQPNPVAPRGGLLDDRFTFLFMMDLRSTVERKNPLGLIEAFCRAFAPGEGPRLLIKTFNGDYEPRALERLRCAAVERPDVDVIDDFLEERDRDGLLAGCDCYVSLHRAEGYGLTLAEAMSLAKPVIATAYSGPLDFVDRRSGYLVAWRPATVGPGCAIYPEGARWAEPDLDHAAELMRHVVANPHEARRRGLTARDRVNEELSPEAVGDRLRARLELLAASSPQRASSEQASLELVRRRTSFPRPSAGARGLVGRALLRGMRPFTYHQHALNEAVATALEESGRRLDRLEEDAAARR